MRTVYEDALVTEYEDGTEEVRFTDEEARVMRQDPVYFGYSCRNGHLLRETDPFVLAEGCPKCFDAGEAGEAPPAPDFPVVRCGHCRGSHVGVGAVRRCART